MTMKDSSEIREFLIVPEVHLPFPRNIAIAIQFVAREITDQNLVRLKLPVTLTPTVTRRDAN